MGQDALLRLNARVYWHSVVPGAPTHSTRTSQRDIFKVICTHHPSYLFSSFKREFWKYLSDVGYYSQINREQCCWQWSIGLRIAKHCANIQMFKMANPSASLRQFQKTRSLKRWFVHNSHCSVKMPSVLLQACSYIKQYAADHSCCLSFLSNSKSCIQ